MEISLAGRHYYLSGISGVIGSALARTLATEGAFVHDCARS